MKNTDAVLELASPGQSSHSTQWLPIITLALATLIVASEMNMAAFALPLISTEMNVGAAATAWVLLAYTLPLVALAIPAGRWVDAADVRWVFMISLVVIGLTGILAAAADSFSGLLLTRVLQGFAAALYLAVYMPVISAAVPVGKRGRAISVIASIMMLGSVALAPLGGWVAEVFGWRMVFLIKVPLVLLIVWLGSYSLPNIKAGRPFAERLPLPHRALWWEAMLIGAALAALLTAFEILESGVLLAAVLSVLSAAILLIWSRLDYSKPVLKMLCKARLSMPLLALMCVAAMVGLMSFSLPFLIVDVMRSSSQTLSALMLGFVIAAAIVSPLAGSLADRFGALRVATVGAALSTLSLLAFLQLDANSSLLQLVLTSAAAGLGMGVFNAPNMSAIMEATPAEASGTASGLSSVARMFGSTLGPALAALAWNLKGGGLAGFHSGVWALAALCGLGFLALLAAASLPRPR